MQVPNKYNRTIYDVETDGSVTVDVYAVLEAFKVTCPARQHAIKKLLCAGLRGKGDSVQDLTEAGEAIARAVRLEKRNCVLRGSAFLAQGDGLPRFVDLTPTGGFAGVIETVCRKCHHRINYPAGQIGDCICSRCRADIDNPGAEQARIDHALKPPESIKAEVISKLRGVMWKERQRGDAPEILPPEGTCNTPCSGCGRLINYALGSAPIPRLCSTCAHQVRLNARLPGDRKRKKRGAPIQQRVYGQDVPPDETLTDNDDWDWEGEPERGELHVYRSAEYIHTTCKTCNNKVTYAQGVKRPDLCRLCIPVTETGPDAPPPVEPPKDETRKEGFDDVDD